MEFKPVNINVQWRTFMRPGVIQDSFNQGGGLMNKPYGAIRIEVYDPPVEFSRDGKDSDGVRQVMAAKVNLIFFRSD